MRAVFVLLPAYNEAASIGSLLDQIDAVARTRPERFQVIVCDDGSRDGTRDVVAARTPGTPVDVLVHRLNRGLGETIRDLFERAAELAQDDDVIVRMDCDDTHDPRYLPAMIAKLDEGCDIVVASRFLPGGGQQGLDRWRTGISLGANLFMRLFFPVRGLREYSCGYRAYRGALIRRAIRFYGNDFVQLKGFGFACTLEKLVKLALLGARVGEVPFVLRYDQKISVSKMVGSITTLGYLVMVPMHYWPWGGWRRFYRQRLARGDDGR